MMRAKLIKFSYLIIVGCVLFLNGCKKDEEKSFNLVGTWTAIDKDTQTDYFTLIFNNNSTFSLEIEYGSQSSNDHKTYIGNYTYSDKLMYFWLESVWGEGSTKAHTAFKVYSISNTEMVTSSFYGGEDKFTWIRE